MKTNVLLLFVFFSIAFLGGCAPSGVVKHEPVVTEIRTVDKSKVLYRSQPWDESQGIEVECKSASKLGCRHKGHIFPWNAWLDKKGYDAKDYDIKEVVQNGNRATVVIVKR